MSNLGLHNLFHRSASFHGVRAARFFFEKGGRLFSPEASIPQKRNMFGEQRASLRGFDILFFTVSFELDYINVIKMLSLSSIPPLVAKRGDRDPLVIAGGVSVTANPSLISPFVDIAFIGDMENGIEKILEVVLSHGVEKKRRILEELSSLEGVYVWGKNDRTAVRRITRDIHEPAQSVLLTQNTEFANMFLIEMVRGCKNRCGFCMTRCAAAPVRSIEKKSILRSIEKALPFTSRIGLIAPVLTDHKDLVEIVEEINRSGGIVSFSSLRAEEFHEGIARLLRANRQKSLTFAPETGSDVLRRSIRKELTNRALLEAVAMASAYGIKRFRYYIMYGLPGEKIDDIRAVASLARETVERFKQEKGTSLHLSINPFIPKKGTSMECASIRPRTYYLEAQDLLRKELSGFKTVVLRFESLRFLDLHYYLSVGDRAVGMLLYDYFLRSSLKHFREHAQRRLQRT